ncbi:dual specificity protein phosphatase 10-like isoform X2 [Leptotrombidium deliense]|uniref:protein-tyrosine-phosphatase n=1 Tax=Leptotrombidium deliense TaxID=299467 RepID=A0A443SEN9_9ACAR|nr:dual specificity protein phosphatase 10-like isoform X2 [Leptotrombidium deliense]
MEKVPKNEPLTSILPFLYLGNAKDALDCEVLHKLGITYILNVTTHLPTPLCPHGSIRNKRLPLIDSDQQNVKQYFKEAFEFIDEAERSGSNILIHCEAGISRSPTIAIAYLMCHKLMSAMDAYNMVKSKRPIISPNFNFMGQLFEFEENLKRDKVLFLSSSDKESSSNEHLCSPIIEAILNGGFRKRKVKVPSSKSFVLCKPKKIKNTSVMITG